MQKGWVKLHRKMLEWEWYDDPVVFMLFIHLVLTANHRDKKWHGILIKRGQTLTSTASLVEELNRPRRRGRRRVKNRVMTTKSIRTALKKLLSTNEVAIKTTSQYTLITVNNYNVYQVRGNTNGKRRANEGQTKGKRRATNKNDKNIKNEKKNKSTSSKQDVELNKQIGECIKLFEPINPSYNLLYNRKPQREAMGEMIKKYGYSKMVRMLEQLPEVLDNEYAPTITTPYQLREKLGSLVQFINRTKNNKKGGVVNV